MAERKGGGKNTRCVCVFYVPPLIIQHAWFPSYQCFGSKINFSALMGQNGATHFDNIGLESAVEKNRSQLRPILMQICQFSLWFLFSLLNHYIVMLLNNFLGDEWKIKGHCLQCLTTLTLQQSIFCMIKTSFELHKFDWMFVFYHFGYHIPLRLSIRF